MRKSETLSGLKTAEPVQIYFESVSARCCNFWAPEFHLLDGSNGQRWYFYYTAGQIANYGTQRTHVLESAGTDPMGPYTYKGRIYDPQNNGWAIDGSILVLDDALYFLFSAWVGDLQSIFIAPMSDPWTISGERVLISKPDYAWEKIGLNVNEGPVALQHDGQTFIVYSASFCGTPDYKLGLLTYVGDDPLDPAAWEKHPEPIFQRSDENGVFAPAHNGFFKSPDGTEDWIVYHANDSISGGCDGGRMTHVQKFTWNEDGTPNFGVPVSADTIIANPSGDEGVDPIPDVKAELEIIRLKSSDGVYMRHANFRAQFDLNVQPIKDSQFIIVPGLADADAVSLMSVNFPGFYLLHRNNAIWLRAVDDSDTYEADVTWWMREGLSDTSGVSFESYNQAGSYMLKGRHLLLLGAIEADDDKSNATFFIEEDR